jgi:hypothetical protein
MDGRSNVGLKGSPNALCPALVARGGTELGKLAVDVADRRGRGVEGALVCGASPIAV